MYDILKKQIWSLFMDGVQLPEGYFEEAVYFFKAKFPDISATHYQAYSIKCQD